MTANPYVVDVGTVSTYWGFAGEDYPSEWSASAGVYDARRRKWSRAAPSFLEVAREGLIPHAFYPDATAPTFLQNYLGIAPSVSPEGVFKYQICKTSLAEGMRRVSHFYARDNWEQADDEHQAAERYLHEELTMKGGHLFMTEPTIKTLQHSEALAEIAFETLECGSFFTMRKGPLSAFALGRPTALVVEAGMKSTTLSPVFEGYALQRHAVEYHVGGGFLQSLVSHALGAFDITTGVYNPEFLFEQNSMTDGAESIAIHPRYIDMVRRTYLGDYFAHVVRFSDQPEDEDAEDSTDNYYELPDGKPLYLGREQIEEIKEFVFRPPSAEQPSFVRSVLSPSALQTPTISHWPGMHGAVVSAAFGCDIEIVAPLLQNVVVAGGGLGAIPGFIDRLARELSAARTYDVSSHDRLNGTMPAVASLKDTSSMKIKCAALPKATEVPMTAWIGASMVSSLASFDAYWITKHEWQEHGCNILSKRLVF